MIFWVDWALWEKLSLVLGLLISLVLIVATCVLIFQRWRTRRYAALEAGQKVVDSEQYPMLAQDDVPFGVRALERGIEVEGIWVSNSNTPVQTPSQTPRQSETPNTIRSLSSSLALNSSQIQEEVPVAPPSFNDVAASCVSLPPLAPTPILSEADVFRDIHYTYEPQRPGGVYSPLLSSTSPNSPSKFSRRSNIVAPADKRASFHTRVLCGRQLPVLKSSASLNDLDESESSSASNDTSAPAPSEQQASRITRLLRRRSSEEFRRKMSAIFNEKIHMTMPSGRLQFNPSLEEKNPNFRKSLLGPWR